KSLSVSQRLWTLGGAAFIGFSTMLGVGWYENMRVDTGLRRAGEIQASVNHINAMRVANLTMVLAAMDIIVDKDDKVVEPARIKLIADSLAALSGGSKDMRLLAAEMNDDNLLKSYDADVATIGKAIQTDLVAMVQKGASEAEFEQI
ncbi:methyl-accepting chemotaxis protein, partial [Bradyrhizobium sp. Lot11]